MGLSLFAFLPPLGVLLAGIAAVSVPIVIHLLSRRRYKVVTWAAMRFLLTAQKQNTRRLRLEQLILLALSGETNLGALAAHTGKASSDAARMALTRAIKRLAIEMEHLES